MLVSFHPRFIPIHDAKQKYPSFDWTDESRFNLQQRMATRIKSDHWFLESMRTKDLQPLNIGTFKIGRLVANDVNVNSKNVSRVHCTLNLENDRVRLENGVSFSL